MFFRTNVSADILPILTFLPFLLAIPLPMMHLVIIIFIFDQMLIKTFSCQNMFLTMQWNNIYACAKNQRKSIGLRRSVKYTTAQCFVLSILYFEIYSKARSLFDIVKCLDPSTFLFLMYSSISKTHCNTSNTNPITLILSLLSYHSYSITLIQSLLSYHSYPITLILSL